MTKDEVLAILIKKADYVSGESISSEIGVSRAAVNGAVKSLKADGCLIDSVTNKGYRLISCPDRLYAGEIYAYLNKERCSNIICLPSVDSTNNILKSMLPDQPPAGTCIIANEQTGGRGRMGRSFISPPNTGIYLSMLLRPQSAVADISEITCWTAVAVHRAILSVFDIRTDIKWVNDLFLNGRKITGILTEMSVEGEIGMISNIIVGIGVNVRQRPEDFPPELRETASSLGIYSGNYELSRAALAAAMIRELDRMNDSWPSDKSSYFNTYRDNCVTVGKNVDVTNYATGAVRHGYAVDVNEDFSLKVRFENGDTEDVRSGEVSVKW
ncbi:BirA family transcriptional regulator, biotin operon repressor / biotin-[acetyl-CoA-carboxylase] ligase [Ruminococcaceae bacterium YRB3002]|nr:BirA family transcriptional regulator, biotin operon repressor / biotin-[acetyl-CoA-carboxylase] ligase [Ruminococcaceae bacterium YRB3002]